MPIQDGPRPPTAPATNAAGRPVIPLSNRGATFRPRRFYLALAIVALVAATGWYVWLRPVAVTVVIPRRGDAIEAVYATGVVEAVDTTRVASTVPGRLVSLLVDEGDSVRTGQTLAQLDDRQARHRMEDALARLAHAEGELNRARDLLARQVRTRQDVERAQEEFDQAAAAVRLTARQVEDHRITAPTDGVVNKRPVEPGETVAVNQTLFEVVSAGRLRVAADVDERDIPGVRMNADMALRTDAFPREAFTARVTAMRKAGDSVTRTFRVEADLPADTKLRIGMTVDVNIVIGRRTDALLIPAPAVRYDPPRGGQVGDAFVLLARDGRAVRVPIVTGAVGTGSVEVKDGLGDSDAVIREPLGGLRDGQRVRVIARAEDRR